MPNLKRLYLLPEAEIEDLYARPIFNEDEQEIHFMMNPQELEVLSKYTNTKTRLFFALQLGYFKAKQQFYSFDFEDVREDVDYLVAQFFNRRELKLSGRISRGYIHQQKQDILKLLNYQDWCDDKKTVVEKHISELLRYYPKVHDSLRQLLVYMESQRIVFPTYRTLQDLFTQAFSIETKRLNQKMLILPESQKESTYPL